MKTLEGNRLGLAEEPTRSVCRNMKKTTKRLNISDIPGTFQAGTSQIQVYNVVATSFCFVFPLSKRRKNKLEIGIKIYIMLYWKVFE